MALHKNKHIREAIQYAIGGGWRYVAGGGGNVVGVQCCPLTDRSGCIFRVYGTPAIPEAHARRIREAVDDCPHG